ncbi:MAG: shikimate dehydrogenase, partial [Acidaminobacteraceae bacterium]
MINGKTNIYALIGNPVSHTFSPIMHNKLFENYKLNSLYCAFQVEEDKLSMALSGVKSLGIKGLNVTIPHKESIMKYLDNISDEAKAIGAVNTVKNINGLTYGYNTDVYGFMKSLNENNIEYINKKIAILGFGGSAKAVVYGLISGGIKELTIYVRNEIKARELSKNMEILSEIQYNIKSINNCEVDLGEVDLIINATPLGMGNLNDKSPIDFRKSNFKQGLAVVDLIYNPMETVLIKDARELGYR